jgi:predicted SprT family Zn-dependent metalloprotease
MELGAAMTLATELMEEHGLRDWTVTLDRAKTRAGSCRWTGREISLSSHLTRLHDEAEVRDTILHEIAHALVGPGHGHDAVWRARAVAIGSSGRRCTSSDAPSVPGSWLGRCRAGHLVHRHRRPTRLLFCRRCLGGTVLPNVLEWTYRGEHVPMHPNFVAELDAIRRAAPERLPGRFGPGTVVRVTAPGPYRGVVGPIVKRGRTRYHVQLDRGVLTIPFAMVEPLGTRGS